MVTRWGLSDRLGPQTYSEESGEVFLGRSVTQHKQVSDVTAHVIDEEVRRVIDSNYQRAYKILQTNMDKLQTMSEALIKYETIDEEMIKDIMEGRSPRPPRGLGRYADADAATVPPRKSLPRRWSIRLASTRRSLVRDTFPDAVNPSLEAAGKTSVFSRSGNAPDQTLEWGANNSNMPRGCVFGCFGVVEIEPLT